MDLTEPDKQQQAFQDPSSFQDARHQRPLKTLCLQLGDLYGKGGMAAVRDQLEARYALSEDKLGFLVELSHELRFGGTPDQLMARSSSSQVHFVLVWASQRAKELEQARLGMAFEKGRTEGREILQGLEQEVRARLKALEQLSGSTQATTGIRATQQHAEDRLFSQRDAARYLGISKPTLLAREKEGLIRAYHPSPKRKVYRKSDLDAFLDASLKT